ncbi:MULTISPECIES: DUF5808 domain-containing protein [Romboutsia]|uniref:DUF1648 domain-containing protein n=1 Tax=Romboutsia hominis TaxID=1507512 RepID=A0A2P2BUS6_9FIRM|nr:MULTISPECIES: DUF5808 domain-containing protein [Romboutsia]MCH1960097.1 DUF5808 domain-containing protein [Romboutsia hominis]MCH1969473.1 DUF5808 domain-containing protein [Romboutsia hominis]MDB8804837.1 DUF5808 domain-containing protein [Romboutsia sp. 1001216sp1]MDB8808152.1 DUF5808 domain-containing protein [Romboutsia sp. 1001216sp1]MDB8810483.1 DUF5808 domain-containing protein [Romboutsia sp. 1001216sp1]
MNNTLALIINLPILALVYVLTYFTQALSGKRQFYGVSLNSDYFTKDEFKRLDKRFKSLLTLGFIVSVLLCLFMIYVLKNYVGSSIVPILGFTIYEFAIYIDVYNKVKALKGRLVSTVDDIELEKTNIILDTDFLNEKNRIIKKYSILYTIPMIIVFIVGIYALTKYNSMADIIPIHWGFNGKADGFTEKSFMSVFGMISMQVGISIIIYISAVYSLKSRIKLSSKDFENSKKANLRFLNQSGLAFFILNALTQILFINIIIAIAHSGDINQAIMIVCTILIILSSIYLTYIYYKSPVKSKDAVYSIDDEDDLWIWGTFYNNPNDPSLFVNKRFGVGWTINIGHLKGKIFFILPFILILIALLAV